MLALLALARSGVPIRKKLGVSVTLRDVVQKYLVVVDGFVGVFASGCLYDKLALNLEKYMVGCERSNWLPGDVVNSRWNRAAARNDL